MTTLPQALTLESGDHLDREEFHRRYTLNPDIHKAELINGVVYVASPVSYTHGLPSGMMTAWLGFYWSTHPELGFGDNTTVFLAGSSEVQPDVCLFRRDGDRLTVITRESGTTWLSGAPDLVVEVALSSASYDLHDKLNEYRLAGVREYIAWQIQDTRILWLSLAGDVYVELQPDERGVIESRQFPGLRLNVPAMLAGRLADVLRELPPLG